MPMGLDARVMQRLTPSAAIVGAVLSGCQTKPAPPAPPVTEVTVVTVAAHPVEELIEFLGEVEARRTVRVRPQVAGVITSRPFREGTEVRPGDVLYRINATIYEAEHRGARARLAEAEAELANTVSTAGRLRPLLAENAVARQDVDNAETAVKRAVASVNEARAAVDQAHKSLDETIVRAEIGGRVGLAALDVGTRVAGPGDVLTTIDVVNPIFVSFRPSAQQQFAWKRDPALRRAIAPGGSARVEAILPDDTPFPIAGRIGFIDPVVDPQTGTQQYRAEFANPDRMLLPGQFVRVRLRGLTRNDAIVVPLRAVLQRMGRQTVYVVDAANKVAAREVKGTSWSNAEWLIEQGLTTGERVVVDGVQKIAPGAVVRATPLRPSTEAAAGNSAK
jgi:membrane fusion protein (multidrug efflux system)